MTVRGDRERDLAALERELAFEARRRIDTAHDLTRRRYELLAQLHDEVANLLEGLAAVYDQIDTLVDHDR